jgi:tRNA dimethylallyltransferase
MSTERTYQTRPQEQEVFCNPAGRLWYVRTMQTPRKNMLVVLGPTASGKTRLGVRLAHALGGEILSADSRQVYRELNIGSGKDLDEYEIEGVRIPYHLIDLVDLDQEFNLFEFQQRFYRSFEELVARRVLPILVGGTGLYLESVLLGYRLVKADKDPVLRREIERLSSRELEERLRKVQGELHNVTDLSSRERTIRAIEIAMCANQSEAEPAPLVIPLVIGTRWERNVLRERIERRLVERLDAGLVEEVEGLLAKGVSPERLDSLGLEYRYVTRFLQGEIADREELTRKLAIEIGHFAKRQLSWFKRMEKRGIQIRWIEGASFEQALALAGEAFEVLPGAGAETRGGS